MPIIVRACVSPLLRGPVLSERQDCSAGRFRVHTLTGRVLLWRWSAQIGSCSGCNTIQR